MKTIKTYILKAIIILLFIFSFYSLQKGSLSILDSVLDWENTFQISVAFSLLVVAVLYMGYKSFKFSFYQYPQIILNMEYYLGILDIIKQKIDNNEFDVSEEHDMVDVEWLIEDIILFYSDNKRRYYPGHLLAKEILHRVRRGDNTLRFINDKL